MWRSVKRFFGVLGVYLYLQLRLYSLWSKLYQNIFQRERRAPLQLHSGYSSIVNTLRRGQLYKNDGPMELWDAIGHPEYVQWVLNTEEQAPMGMDCDEHAIYIAAAIKISVAAGVFLDAALVDANLLTVTWIDGRGEYGGHNAALLYYRGARNTFSYMDYGFPSKGKGSIEEVANDIVARYAGSGASCLAWAIHTPNLKVKTVVARFGG